MANRIFSAIQPTGVPSLGNYLGALRRWAAMQDSVASSRDALFCVANLHSMTNPSLSAAARLANTQQIAVILLACGIDPARSSIFVQSAVREHSELAWILSCHTSVGGLQRMTQWKSKKKGDSVVGLLTYPVLMAADILLYKATRVPVGDDQQQHLEFARQVARSFNHSVGDSVFADPLGETDVTAARIMSLRDPTSKMSKSDASPWGYISLDDDRATIKAKLARAVTDSEAGVEYAPERRPAVSNLVQLAAACRNVTPDAIVRDCASLSGKQAFKDMLTDTVDECVAPVRTRMAELQRDPQYVAQVLAQGASTAQSLASETMAHVRASVGAV